MSRYRQLIASLTGILTAGMTPRKWAASAAFGLVAALFPIIGPTTLLCVLICWITGLHLPLVLLLLYGLYPIQLALIIPFTGLGCLMTGWHLPDDLSPEKFLRLSSWGREAIRLGIAAVAGWAITTIPSGYLVYRALLRYARRKQAVSTLPPGL